MTPAAPQPELSPEQQAAFALAVRGGAHLFLTGRAGTGKTTVTRAILRAMGTRAAVLAPTGVAAMSAGGQTLHSFFQLPPRLILPHDVRRGRNGAAMRALTTLVIDEISMVRADVMQAVDTSLRMNRGTNAPFGGVRMVLVGDLAQLPPVIQGEEAAHLEDMYGGPFFFHAPAFREAGFSILELNQVHRQADSDFIDILNAVREGALDNDQAAQLNERVSARSGLQASETHVVLTATNQAASAINQARLDALVGEPRGFAGKVEGEFDPRLFPTEDPLILKTGARVMLIRNDPGGRYVNGSIGEVIGFGDGAVMVRVNGESVRVEPVSWERTRYAVAPGAEGGLKRERVGSYAQYPLRLAWAMTIHKAQGLTLERVYLDVSRRLFAHGQAYVALSRARSLAGLELSAPLRPSDIITDPRLFDVRSFCDPVSFQLKG